MLCFFPMRRRRREKRSMRSLAPHRKKAPHTPLFPSPSAHRKTTLGAFAFLSKILTGRPTTKKKIFNFFFFNFIMKICFFTMPKWLFLFCVRKNKNKKGKGTVIYFCIVKKIQKHIKQTNDKRKKEVFSMRRRLLELFSYAQKAKGKEEYAELGSA